jgi:hypothetical protein
MENSPFAQKELLISAGKNRNKKRSVVAFIVIMLLLVTNIFLLVKVLENDKKVHQQEKIIVSTKIEKDALYAQLQIEKSQFEQMRSENTSLNRRLSAKDKEIKEKIAQIETLINSGDEAQLRKAKSELLKLRRLNDQYIAQITNLKKENENLQIRNVSLTESLTEEQNKFQALVQQNTVLAEKVARGSVLRTDYIFAKGVRYRTSGKEVETNKASRTEKVKICFTILENKVVDKGTKTMFLRLIAPGGATLSTVSETINYKGTPLMITSRQEINYENRDTPLCLLYTKNSPFQKGEYTAELYSEGNMIGTTKFTLK